MPASRAEDGYSSGRRGDHENQGDDSQNVPLVLGDSGPTRKLSGAFTNLDVESNHGLPMLQATRHSTGHPARARHLMTPKYHALNKLSMVHAEVLSIN